MSKSSTSRMIFKVYDRIRLYAVILEGSKEIIAVSKQSKEIVEGSKEIVQIRAQCNTHLSAVILEGSKEIIAASKQSKEIVESFKESVQIRAPCNTHLATDGSQDFLPWAVMLSYLSQVFFKVRYIQ
ncbi:hypothetical protein F0562_013266 [Nyssa sinensis]|uniref:Uncharacterized protein n=1 Tax=Nyssa sinensis TaxID=561372 RepID=A0A5J4ZUA5_9ASTE|nr:hypothetical protein F0562_013266 [Nyssa sinensis]